MRTIAKTMTFLSIILISSLSLTGQKTLLLQDIQPLMAYATDTRHNVELTAELNASSYRFYVEDKIQLSNWMVNRLDWGLTKDSRLASAIRLENEREPAIENWMVHASSTGEFSLVDALKPEAEPPLQLQDWMICCTDW